MPKSSNPNVSRWWPLVRDTRVQMGLSEDTYPDEVVLALIDVESDGDDRAHRPGSQFHGLLQMGRYAGIDAGLDDAGRDTTRSLMGDGAEALRAFFTYQERYARRHCYQPSRIAALWKAGPGTLAQANRLLHRGRTLDDALAEAADRYDVPNVVEYVRRFRAARQVWRQWLDAA
ncbi:hypothetical protein FIV42_16045 [Persicimonas caeni]|uniref:Lytic transglycosylase domain-containing protein n=1 Tax=Persicimonas caeni TaxID=2292766 RepID=A0A4Y6PW16_PERCE|nr:hypothetical protein [Persicimonas caeni]QDG52197.1 hypothetical protein FIV42_16045 [Persicimonas caeni]QED33419.1 hypothetical protein FRD00_16040 [Persicimonas caeni]